MLIKAGSEPRVLPGSSVTSEVVTALDIYLSLINTKKIYRSSGLKTLLEEFKEL